MADGGEASVQRMTIPRDRIQSHSVTTDGRRQANDGRRQATGDQRQAAIDRRQAINDRRQVASSQLQATSDQLQPTGGRWKTTDDRHVLSQEVQRPVMSQIKEILAMARSLWERIAQSEAAWKETLLSQTDNRCPVEDEQSASSDITNRFRTVAVQTDGKECDQQRWDGADANENLRKVRKRMKRRERARGGGRDSGEFSSSDESESDRQQKRKPRRRKRCRRCNRSRSLTSQSSEISASCSDYQPQSRPRNTKDEKDLMSSEGVVIFSGSPKDFETWVRRYERAFKHLGWPKKWRCSIIERYLEDEAYDQWYLLRKHEKKDWSLLKDRMNILFPRIRPHEDVLRNQFGEIAQSERESIRGLASRINKLAALAWPDSTWKDMDRRMQRQFRCAVWSNRTRDALIQREFHSFEDMVHEAIGMEARYRESYRVYSRGCYGQVFSAQEATAQQQASEPGADAVVMRPVETQATSTPKDLRQSRSGYQRSKRKCYNCGEYGHVARECPMLRGPSHFNGYRGCDSGDHNPGLGGANNGGQCQSSQSQGQGQQAASSQRSAPNNNQGLNGWSVGQAFPQATVPPGTQSQGNGDQGGANDVNHGVKSIIIGSAGLTANLVYDDMDQYVEETDAPEASNPSTQQQPDEQGDDVTTENVFMSSRRIEQDMSRLQRKVPIKGYNCPTSCIMFPVTVNSVPVVAFIDSGSTTTVISSRLAYVLECAGLAKTVESDVKAEVFGAGDQYVRFERQVVVQIQIAGYQDRFIVQVLKGMRLDCLIGDNAMRRLMVDISYHERTIAAGGHTIPWLCRGEAILMMQRVEDQYRGCRETYGDPK
jgi:hypothetical protein